MKNPSIIITAFLLIFAITVGNSGNYWIADRVHLIAFAVNDAEISKESIERLSSTLDGSWTLVGSREINGSFSLPEDGCSIKVVLNNDNGALRYSIQFWIDDTTYLYGTAWSTETQAFFNPLTFNSAAANRIVVRLQNASGTGSIPVERGNDFSVYFICPYEEREPNRAETVYVDAKNGDDANNGLARAVAFETIQRAIDTGAKNIYVREGEYAPFTIVNKTGISIDIDHYYDAFDAETNHDPHVIIINGKFEAERGIYISNSNSIRIKNVDIKNCTEYGVFAYRNNDLLFRRCSSHDIYNSEKDNVSFGFRFDYTDANLYSCLAYNIGTITAGKAARHCDGFNIHNTGDVNLYDCSAYNCEDDGVSHHDATTGIVDGGEWSYCGKGGVCTPTGGAVVHVKNVYCHHNRFGIYAQMNQKYSIRPNILISGCVSADNTDTDIRVEGYYAIIMNCVYQTQSINAQNLSEYVRE